MRRIAKPRRTNISATLDAEVAKWIAEYQHEAGLRSFSAAVEELLWRRFLEEWEKAYWLSMSKEERAEQRAWAKFATEQFAKVVQDD